MKNYPIVCPSCNGTGYISETAGLTSNTQKACPACQGTGVVICHEEDKK